MPETYPVSSGVLPVAQGRIVGNQGAPRVLVECDQLTSRVFYVGRVLAGAQGASARN